MMTGNIGSTLYTAGTLALLGGGAGATYVQYSTYQNNDCETIISTSVYAGVPTVGGVEMADTCLDYEESTTTTFVSSGLTDGRGLLSMQHVCNTTEPGALTTMWYATDDCDPLEVSLEFAQDVCTASCTAEEPDFGSDEIETATVTFYDSAECTDAVGTAAEYEGDLYAEPDFLELYGAGRAACLPSGDYDLYAVLHCSGGMPAMVYYEDDECAGDMVGMTYNAGCAPVPSNGTFAGDWFMAECTEGVVADDDVAEEEEDTGPSANGATSSLTSMFSVGVAVASAATAISALF